MPRKTWTAKNERQYKAVKKSCLAVKRCRPGRMKTKCVKLCERIAAATVNKGRKAKGAARKRSVSGARCPCKRAD